MDDPLFSIIIVNFNGKEYLNNCLASVFNSACDDYEIIIVDNGSTDGSIEFVKDTFSTKLYKIRIINLKRNFGPARARNDGVKIARGKYIGFLDNDTEVDKNWILEAIKGFESSKDIAALQCKLLFIKNKHRIDYVGEYLSNLGFLIPVAVYGEEDNGQYDFKNRILSAKSAGMFIKKSVFDRIDGFDEDYFIFMEETDLNWRAWLSGYEIVFWPPSVVYHSFSATKDIVDKRFNNRLVRFHGTKNYILTLYKNLSIKYCIKILPLHVFLWFCLSFYLLVRGNIRSSLNIFQGILWNLVNFGKNSRKRALVQKNRIRTDTELFVNFGLIKKRSFYYFINKFIQSQKVAITPENQ